MMNSSTLEDLKADKSKLEKDIVVLLTAFQNKYKVNISDVSLDHFHTMGDSFEKVAYARVRVIV